MLTAGKNNENDMQVEVSPTTPTAFKESDDMEKQLGKSPNDSINSFDDTSVYEDSASKKSPDFLDNSNDLSTPKERYTSDASRNYNGAMRRLLDKQRNTDSVSKKHDDSSISLGERLRAGEFIGDA